MEQDFYKILGIDPGAPEREIKRAYYSLASKLHPDKAKNSELRRQNEEELALVSAAYNVLKDPAKRQEYDARRRENSTAFSSSTSATATANGEKATPNPSASSAASAARRSTGAAPRKGKSSADLTAHRVSIAERAFAKGMQLFNTREFAEAVPFFEAAIQNDETKTIYHVKLAIALIRSRGSYTRAVRHAQRAIEADPYSLEYKMILADIHETAGAITAAKKIYEEVLKWEPDNENARIHLDFINSGGKGGGFLSGLMKKIKKK